MRRRSNVKIDCHQSDGVGNWLLSFASCCSKKMVSESWTFLEFIIIRYEVCSSPVHVHVHVVVHAHVMLVVVLSTLCTCDEVRSYKKEVLNLTLKRIISDNTGVEVGLPQQQPHGF